MSLSERPASASALLSECVSVDQPPTCIKVGMVVSTIWLILSTDMAFSFSNCKSGSVRVLPMAAAGTPASWAAERSSSGADVATTWQALILAECPTDTIACFGHIYRRADAAGDTHFSDGNSKPAVTDVMPR